MHNLECIAVMTESIGWFWFGTTYKDSLMDVKPLDPESTRFKSFEEVSAQCIKCFEGWIEGGVVKPGDGVDLAERGCIE